MVQYRGEYKTAHARHGLLLALIQQGHTLQRCHQAVSCCLQLTSILFMSKFILNLQLKY